MTALIAFFTASAFGRLLAKIGAAVLLVGAVLWKYARMVRKDERAKQSEDRAKAIQRGAKGAADAVAELKAGQTPQQVKESNDAAWR